jgi:DNA replication protein DnaC
MCPGFVQSSITYAYEKFLAAAIKRMIALPSTIEKKMEKTKSRVHPELFARLADTRDSVATTLQITEKLPDAFQKAAEQLGQLDEEQEKAINFSGNFQIICGGPGSGKTLVLIRLAQRYAEKYPPIKLQTDKVLPRIQIVAPTHKALQVIKTRFSKEKVPHDVVEFNTCASVAMPGSQRKAKVLIVDECGMVGTKLLYSVLLNVNPKIVCLFGDPNQLPPIDIGNPFGSLIQAATVPRVKLLRNYRQEGRGIHHVVKGVLEGEWRGGNADVAVNPKSILRMGYNELRRYMNPLPKMLVSPTNRVVDFLNNAIYTLNYKSPLRSGNRVLIVDPISPDNRLGTITTLYGPDSDALVSLDGTNAPEKFPQCMLRALPYAVGQKLSLAKMHTGMRLRFIQKCGDDADIIQPNTLATCMETPGELRFPVEGKPKCAQCAECVECAGELRFPMERKPKCAQCARCVKCAKHDEIKIKIDGELCERPVRLDCLALGWAYTVHKSQGSEEDDVMFVVAERDESWCDRSLVYVALSRAKKSLRINGSDSQLRQMVARPPQKPCDLIALRVL